MLVCVRRLTRPEESAWGDEDEADHNYYNSIPGKEPPPGGLVDSRLTLAQPGALGALGQVSPVGLLGVGGCQGGPWASSFSCSLPHDPNRGSLPPPLPSPNRTDASGPTAHPQPQLPAPDAREIVSVV